MVDLQASRHKVGPTLESSGEPAPRDLEHPATPVALGLGEKLVGKVNHTAVPPKSGPKQSGILPKPWFSSASFSPDQFPRPSSQDVSDSESGHGH